MRIAVAGGFGFVGTHLVPLLVTNGHAVTILSRKKGRAPSGASVSVVSDIDSYQRAVSSVDILINLVGRFLPPFEEQISANVLYPHMLIEQATASQVKRVIHVSAAGVYGDSYELPKETDTPHPTTLYGLSKHMGEQLVSFMGTGTGVEICVVRPTNIYGSGASAGVVSDMVRSARENQRIRVTGDGSQVRDFIHVDDVASALLALVQKWPGTSVYNISSMERYSIQTLATMVAAQVKGVSIEHTNEATGYARRIVADSTKLASFSQWKPAHFVDTTIQSML